MHSSLTVASVAGLLLSTLVAAAPFKFPLANGFPTIANPSNTLTQLEQQAHGSLPNGPPPKSLSSDTFTSLRLIAFNELAEVAFFTELIANITNKVDGYNKISGDKTVDKILADLTAIQAQEELHLLNANGALDHFNEGPIQPCQYNFPVTTFDEAIALAATFTDVVLGTLPDVQTHAATAGDIGLINGVASVLGQEGEQDGFFRTILGKIPSALPFLTAATREFAFSALTQNFVVPGSCPNIQTIGLPIFAALSVDTTADSNTKSIKFSLAAAGSSDSASNYNGKSIVYINQQNTPVVESLQNVSVKNGKVTFTANFPFDAATFGNGLTIAALTNGAGPFADAAAVAAATVAGPGLIEIN